MVDGSSESISVNLRFHNYMCKSVIEKLVDKLKLGQLHNLVIIRNDTLGFVEEECKSIANEYSMQIFQTIY